MALKLLQNNRLLHPIYILLLIQGQFCYYSMVILLSFHQNMYSLPNDQNPQHIHSLIFLEIEVLHSLHSSMCLFTHCIECCDLTQIV